MEKHLEQTLSAYWNNSFCLSGSVSIFSSNKLTIKANKYGDLLPSLYRSWQKSRRPRLLIEFGFAYSKILEKQIVVHFFT